jgi:hypothetical protein
VAKKAWHIPYLVVRRQVAGCRSVCNESFKDNVDAVFGRKFNGLLK